MTKNDALEFTRALRNLATGKATPLTTAQLVTACDALVVYISNQPDPDSLGPEERAFWDARFAFHYQRPIPEWEDDAFRTRTASARADTDLAERRKRFPPPQDP